MTRKKQPAEPVPETLGQRITRLRKPRGTQAQFAKATGIAIGSIRNFEQDRVLPTVPNLVLLAEALGVTTDELLKDVEFKVVKTPRRRGRPANPA